MTPCLFTALGLIAASTTASASPAAAEPGMDPVLRAELRDQHGRVDSVAAHLDGPVVVLVVTARRLRNLKDWEVALHEHHGGVPTIRIADVPRDEGADRPAPAWDEVANTLRRRVPEEVPVLIDLERRFATAYSLDTDRPNLLLFDGSGRLAAWIRGRHDPDTFEELCRAIDALRADEAAGPRGAGGPRP